MTMHFMAQTVSVPSGKGRRSVSANLTFGSKVNDAAVVLTGFRLTFGGQDRRIDDVEVRVQRDSVSDRTVNFTVACNLSDENKNDRYEGSVAVLVIADVA
jgi:hypothetical protein